VNSGPTITSALMALGCFGTNYILRATTCEACGEPAWSVLQPNVRVRGKGTSLVGVVCRRGQHTRRAA
jgi:RNase P subunit RPR2